MFGPGTGISIIIVEAIADEPEEEGAMSDMSAMGGGMPGMMYFP